MVNGLSDWNLRKKGEISLRQIAIIILALLVAVAFYFIMRGVRNAVLPK